ncbi:MAG: hypothetical protein IJ134_00680 [Bacilli bacterium]|nr:hypothetical protein [Bacilli bacterium]
MKKKIAKIANKNFKKIFSTYKKDIDLLRNKFDENIILFDSYLDEKTKDYWIAKLDKTVKKAYKPSYLKSKLAVLGTTLGVLVGSSACADSNSKKPKSTQTVPNTTTTITNEDKKIEIAKPIEQQNEEITTSKKSTVDLSKYVYDYHDFDKVSSELANLGDINVLAFNSWLAGSKNMSEDSELMLKFYIAANHNVLYEPNSVYASIIQKYTATDLYTSFFQVIDDLQVKAVFATEKNDIHFSKYFISTTDRKYLENLERLLMNYNNAKDKTNAREEISKWVDQNVVSQDYGNVSKAAVIVSYRLIQNARLTNAVENIAALDNVKDLDKVDDKYKTTTDYLVTKFLDSKEISCNGYVESSKAVKTTLSDDSIDFIEGVKEFHNTLFNQTSSKVSVEELIEMINSKRIEYVKSNSIKTAEELKDEYLEKLKKVDPSNPVFSTVPSGGETVISLSESEKAQIRKQTESKTSSATVVKDNTGKTLATGSSANTYDTTAYQNGYNAGSAQGAIDGASGKSRNNSTSGKAEYVEGYKLGYNSSYDDAKAVYDKAVEQNKNPKVTYEKVDNSNTKQQTTTDSSSNVKTEASKTESKTSSTQSSTNSTQTNTSSSSVSTNETTSFEFSEGVTMDSNGNISYNGSTITLSDEDAEWIASMTQSNSSENKVKTYTK